MMNDFPFSIFPHFARASRGEHFPFARRAGFTLVELLVVVAIIGLMSTLLMANFTAARERSRDAQRKSDINQIRNALRLYYNDFQKYPAGSSGTMLGCGANGDTACPSGDNTWTAKSQVYMSKFPKDPKTQAGYYYERIDLDSFKLTACLENVSDTSGQSSVNGCAWGYQVSEQ